MRKYSITGETASNTFTKTCLIQIKSGAASLWIDYVAVDGNALTPASPLDVALVRCTAAGSAMTAQSPLLLDPDDAAALAVSGTAATAVWVSTQTDPTYGDILWRRQWSTMSGGGGSENFAPGQIAVVGGGATTKGIIALKVNTTLTAAAALSYTLHFTEVG